MATWLKQRFGDERTARDTLAVGVLLAGSLGFVLVVVSAWLSRA